jgi:hypothetical protein
MFGKYNGFVSKARVSACVYFLVSYKMCAVKVRNAKLRNYLKWFLFNSKFEKVTKNEFRVNIDHCIAVKIKKLA